MDALKIIKYRCRNVGVKMLLKRRQTNAVLWLPVPAGEGPMNIYQH